MAQAQNRNLGQSCWVKDAFATGQTIGSKIDDSLDHRPNSDAGRIQLSPLLVAEIEWVGQRQADRLNSENSPVLNLWKKAPHSILGTVDSDEWAKVGLSLLSLLFEAGRKVVKTFG